MTGVKLAELINREGMLEVGQGWGGLTFPVRVIDAKSSYGTPRVLVEPIGGSGQEWVAASRVKFI